jgi:hypothetical protein
MDSGRLSIPGRPGFQQWDRPLHEWLLQQRQAQARTGRIIPQVDEEYGYEDHYPSWAPYRPPAASSDANRRAAWEISMAGAYQTTGETAKRGTGVADELVDSGAFCLAEPGNVYVVYLRHRGSVTAMLDAGRYRTLWFNPRSGQYADAPDADGPVWTSPQSADREDWVIRLQRVRP